MAYPPSSTTNLYSVDELITKGCMTRMMMWKEQMENPPEALHGRALSTLLMLRLWKLPYRETGKPGFIDMYHCVLDPLEAGEANQDQRLQLHQEIFALAYTLS